MSIPKRHQLPRFLDPARQNLHESFGQNALKIKAGIDKGRGNPVVPTCQRDLKGGTTGRVKPPGLIGIIKPIIIYLLTNQYNRTGGWAFMCHGKVGFDGCCGAKLVHASPVIPFCTGVQSNGFSGLESGNHRGPPMEASRTRTVEQCQQETMRTTSITVQQSQEQQDE